MMEEEYEEELQDEKINLKTWKKLFKVILKSKKALIRMLIAVCIMTCVDIGYPLLNKYALETFFGENPDFSNRYLFYGLYALVAVSMGLSVWAFIRAAAQVEEQTTYDIRIEAFRHLQELSFSYYDTTQSGWIMARMTSDTRKLASIISWGIVDFLWGFMLMLGILTVTIVIDWRLALILIALIPIFFGVSVFFRKQILKQYRKVRKVNSSITAAYNESFMGANTTKTLVLEKDNAKEFNTVNRKLYRRSIKTSLISGLFWPSILFIGYVGAAFVCHFGANLVISDAGKGLFTVATLYLFIDYAIKFFDPIMQISRVLSDFQQAQASAERVLSLIDTPSDINDTDEVITKYGTIFKKKPENWEKIKGDINFNNVSFKYKNTENYVLKDFNLEIKAGEMVAFVGETGSGKSTIVNLISRFYEPTNGEILIDGRNYQERSISWLHDNLGYVLQTPQLFSGTIKENIAYGKLDATMDEIIHAAKLANAHEFISKLENGYDTVVGEGGNKLSLGEKQLISFARAVVSNPSILVLDEATSSIDTENERVILQAMETVLKERTSLIVAHRLSTIVKADKIIVLQHGKIIEMGTHKELLKNRGYYFELYRNQFMQELENKMVKEM